jgi:predicted transcriptional regulator YheO
MTKATGNVENSAEEQVVLDSIMQMVNDVQDVVPSYMEIVIHDFAKLPNSVVTIAGNVTGRTVGSPATNVLLRDYARDELGRYALAYESTLPDGRKLNCSSILIKVHGKAIGVLCVNVDTSVFASAADALATIFPSLRKVSAGRAESDLVTESTDETDVTKPEDGDIRGKPNKEVYPRTIDDLMGHLVESSIAAIGIPVELMRKEHKKAVVRDLQDRGAFAVKNSADSVAAVLQVSRFTVYNYLNELEAEGSARRT